MLPIVRRQIREELYATYTLGVSGSVTNKLRMKMKQNAAQSARDTQHTRELNQYTGELISARNT